MKRMRRVAVGTIWAVLVACGAVTLYQAGNALARDSGCQVSTGAATAAFVGTVVDKAGPVVTFQVQGPAAPGGEAMLPAAAGEPVEVSYPYGHQRFVHRGQSYQVSAWGDPGFLGSDVATAGVPCAVNGTLHADGSSIDTGLFTADGFQPWLIAPAILVVAAVIALAHRLWRRRSARRSPAPSLPA